MKCCLFEVDSLAIGCASGRRLVKYGWFVARLEMQCDTPSASLVKRLLGVGARAMWQPPRLGRVVAGTYTGS